MRDFSVSDYVVNGVWGWVAQAISRDIPALYLNASASWISVSRGTFMAWPLMFFGPPWLMMFHECVERRMRERLGVPYA